MKKTIPGLALCALLLPAAALAQAGPGGPPAPYDATIPVPQKEPEATSPVAPEDAALLAEVVVNARRIAESQQNVPVAISAMSDADLQREAINSPQDLQGRVPSLVVGTSSQMRNTEAPAIRGQGQEFGAAPGVIIYFGEVPQPTDPIASNQGGPGKFFDLSNVQILKGSQGTLFGRNTTGGALLLQPRRPDESLSARLRAEGTSYSGRGYEGVLNVPVVPGTLLVRVGGKFFDREGLTRDVSSGKDYDSKHFWTSRLGITWRPTDNVENYLLGYYTDSNDNGTGTVIEEINREGLNRGFAAAIGLGIISVIPGLDLSQTANIGCMALNLFGPSTNCGQDILDEQHARGIRQVQLSANPNDFIKTGALIDDLRIELSESLAIRNIASYARFKHHYRWDIDGSRAAFTDFNNPDEEYEADLSTITEELQLQGSAFEERLTFVLGGYYETSDIVGHSEATALFVENIVSDYSMKRQSYAPFAQGSYDLGGVFDALSGLNLTIGARFTWDRTTAQATFVQRVMNAIPLVDEAFGGDIRASALTYTAGLDYKYGTHLTYGKVSRGYKTGGFAPVSVHPAHHTFLPEYVFNYEIGQKSDFKLLGMPARVNASLYYTDYTNLQKSGTDTYQPPNTVNVAPTVGAAIFNVGKASIAGLELEATVRPFQSLTLLATYGHTRAEYKEFNLLVGDILPHLDCTGQEIEEGSIAELSCIPVQNTPKNQFSLTGRWVLPLPHSVGIVESAATYAWTAQRYGAQTTLPEAEPGAWLPAYGLINASLHWKNVFGTALDVLLYGTNLADKEYRISNSSVWNLTFFRSSIYSEPRIIGLQIGYSFD